MNLRQALRAEGLVRLAFVGAGGKTTALFQFGEQIPGPVILTASTHLAVAQTLRAGRHVIVTRAEEIRAVIRAAGTASTLLLTGLVGGDSRTPGLDMKLLEVVRTEAARRGYPVLVEADGSRRKPLKAPAEHEPAVPGWVDTVVVCAGLSALGKRLDEETVHRSDIFARLTGLPTGAVITPEAVCACLVHPQGGLKSIPEWARKVALLNQADTSALDETAREMAPGLLRRGYDLVIVAKLAESDPEQQVKAACQRTAGIVLAAGGAQRFGQPKVLLEWQGQPLVRRAVETALKAGLEPVRLVCGMEEAAVRRAVEGLPVEVIANPRWQEGQSTSVAAGLRQLPRRTGAAVFLLADQPLVTAGIIRALTRRHDETLAAITAPRVNGRRTNPVLFDQVCFGELGHIQGDTGGRALFERFPVSWLDSEDERLLFDVDTQEDYQRLLGMTAEEQ